MKKRLVYGSIFLISAGSFYYLYRNQKRKNEGGGSSSNEDREKSVKEQLQQQQQSDRKLRKILSVKNTRSPFCIVNLDIYESNMNKVSQMVLKEKGTTTISPIVTPFFPVKSMIDLIQRHRTKIDSFCFWDIESIYRFIHPHFKIVSSIFTDHQPLEQKRMNFILIPPLIQKRTITSFLELHLFLKQKLDINLQCCVSSTRNASFLVKTISELLETSNKKIHSSLFFRKKRKKKKKKKKKKRKMIRDLEIDIFILFEEEMFCGQSSVLNVHRFLRSKMENMKQKNDDQKISVKFRFQGIFIYPNSTTTTKNDQKFRKTRSYGEMLMFSKMLKKRISKIKFSVLNDNKKEKESSSMKVIGGGSFLYYEMFSEFVDSFSFFSDYMMISEPTPTSLPNNSNNNMIIIPNPSSPMKKKKREEEEECEGEDEEEEKTEEVRSLLNLLPSLLVSSRVIKKCKKYAVVNIGSLCLSSSRHHILKIHNSSRLRYTPIDQNFGKIFIFCSEEEEHNPSKTTKEEEGIMEKKESLLLESVAVKENRKSKNSRKKTEKNLTKKKSIEGLGGQTKKRFEDYEIDEKMFIVPCRSFSSFQYKNFRVIHFCRNGVIESSETLFIM